MAGPSEQLALLGGAPRISAPFEPYASIGAAEIEAVRGVLESGVLSGFYGSPGPAFDGGPVVQEFEQAWRTRFGTAHCISVNSATSGLFAAMGAIGVGPGDEVIVPPLTMSATAMAPIVYGAVPVFADVDSRTFCLEPDAVRAAITPRTRAILAVNLFGHPAPLAELAAIAREHGLRLVEDAAQSPLAAEDGRLAGTVGDIGVFSLNYHKHIHTGEGGMCVADDEELALRLSLIRNHGENVVEELALDDLTNLVGFNYRMTEMSAAVGLAQLAGADGHIDRRVRVAEALTDGVRGLEGLTPPEVRAGCRHVYYLWGLRVNEAALGISRDVFSRALLAEGVPHGAGYVRPLYMLPLFQRRLAIGRHGHPFTESDVSYESGLCPVAERVHESELVSFETCMYDLDEEDVEAVVDAIRKVHAHREQLAEVPAAAERG